MYEQSNQLIVKEPYLSSFFRVLTSTIVKDVKISFRYRANLIGGLIQVAVFVISFYLLSIAIDFRDSGAFVHNPGDQALFIFFLSGIIAMLFQETALYTPLNRINRDLYNGTLEYIYSNPSSRYAYYLGGIISDIIVKQIFVVPMIVLLYFLTAYSLMFYVALLFFLVLVISLGVILSMFALLFKQVENLVGIFQILFQFVGGIFIPVQSMPEYLKWVAYALPFSYAYDLIRYYSFQGNWNPILPLALEWTMLILSTMIFFALSILLLRKTEQQVRKSGLHLI